MNIIVCDKCGEKIIELHKCKRELITLYGFNKKELWDLDLCEKCFEIIRSGITKYFGSPTESQDVVWEGDKK